MPFRIGRAAYADMFGPTVGDKVRLADTELFIEVEQDHTIYGEEVKFGGGKVIRDGMGQSQVTRATGAVDTVITNALILDHWGVVKADIGFHDPGPVDDQRVGDDGVGGTLGAGDLGLAHAVADDLAAAELHLLAVGGEILLHLDDQVGVGEADAVADGRAEHVGIGGAGDACGHDVLKQSEA